MIITYPDQRLRQKSLPVEVVDQKLKKIIQGLKTELLAKNNGLGLAAPQLGENKRVFAIKDFAKSYSPDQPYLVEIFINPEIKDCFDKEKVYPKIITKDNKKTNFLEGCLSLPGLWGRVKRWLKIKVSWQSLVGENLISKEKIIKGLKAVVFQHELDHLEGILFIDRVKEEKGNLYQIDKKGRRKEILLKKRFP